MPRNPSGVYSLPNLPTDGETIDADDVNTPFQDIESDLNAIRPIVAGGTGGDSKENARSALGLGSMATQNQGNVDINGGDIVIDRVEINDTEAVLAMRSSNAPLNLKEKRIRVQEADGDVVIQSYLDAGGFNETLVVFTARGTTLDQAFECVTREKGDARYAQYQTGGTTGDTDFGIGQIILVETTAEVDRRDVVAARLGNGNQYLDSGAGATLSGTWRSLGPITISGTSFCVAQRVV